jgi:Flp pilus assembly protein TadG
MRRAGGRIARALRSALSRGAADRRGSVALIFAFALPIALVLVCGAVDLTSVGADRSKVQDAADAAALAAAKQLGVSDARGVAARAESYVKEHLAGLDSRLTYKVVATTADDLSSVTVAVTGKRTSFFANMLPPGGWPVEASATASPVGQMPLCVLSSGQRKDDAVEMKDSAQVTAGGCLVHSNGDIDVASTAWLNAAMVQAAGEATGRISPEPQQSAPGIGDPFATMTVKTPDSLCLPVDLILNIGLNTLPPGVHCANYKAPKGTTLRLLPGDHYFKGTLELTENAILQGSDVVLVFDKDADFKFKDNSQVNLTGRSAGVYAGFVLATTRLNNHEFEISSDSARQLLGAIYIPNARLKVTGRGNKIADQSAWTVIVAKSIKMEGSPNLVINSNYAGSKVPVPRGVGSATEVRLNR